MLLLLLLLLLWALTYPPGLLGLRLVRLVVYMLLSASACTSRCGDGVHRRDGVMYNVSLCECEMCRSLLTKQS
jgi:hypothetical protein